VRFVNAQSSLHFYVRKEKEKKLIRLSTKLKKIDREYLLTDSTVNTYGFRLLTSGYLSDEFKKNPIGYYMHERENGVVLKWEDIRIDGDKVLGKPVINMSHPRGQQTVDEIENGFLNSASVGRLIILEYTDDEALKVEGQTGPTATKWYNRECSLVDLGGNLNALAPLLYDQFDNPLQLSDFQNLNILKTHMKKFEFSPAQIAALNLKADAEESSVITAFNDLVARAAKADSLQLQLDNLKDSTQKGKVISLIAEAKTSGKIGDALAVKLSADYATNPEGLKSLIDALPGGDGKVSGILTKALADKKITQELSNKLAVDYKDNATGLQNLIDAMPAYKSVTDELNGAKGGNEKRIADLKAKSFDDLMSSGESAELQRIAPDVWKEKLKEEAIN
jgi:hypothetical protein